MAKTAKAKTKKTESIKKAVETPKPSRYWEGVGRRKTSVARVRIYEQGQGEVAVNGRGLKDYFPVFSDQQKVLSPLEKVSLEKNFDVKVIARGGGVHSQAEAVRHGLARAILAYNQKEFRSRLRALGYLTRDPRMRERKKPGLKRARRAPQWQKR